MRKTVDGYAKSCRICKQTKAWNHKPYGLLPPIPSSESDLEVITIDLSIPLREIKNGNSGILNDSGSCQK